MKEGIRQFVNIKIRLLKVILLQVWAVCGVTNSRLPKILEMPQNFIYAPTKFDPVSFYSILTPFDARLLLLVRYSHESKYGFHTLYNSSKDLSGLSSLSLEPLMVTVSFNIHKKENQVSFNITLSNWIRLRYQPIHLHISSPFGSFLSAPIKIETYELSKFIEMGDEYVEFVMGNVGQIVCEIPPSKPNPPLIQFQHHSVLLNVANDSRYVIVEFPPLFDRVALLIRNIMFEDSGIYRCISSLENTKLHYVSEKKTHLIVKVPKRNIPTRFRLSSHSTLNDSNKIDVNVKEGSQLVLYCIYESAPILEVNWYWPKNDRQYQINTHFGLLTISNVSVRDNSDVSCIINEGKGKIFHINVIQLPQIIITPSLIEISEKTFNTSVSMKCEGNFKNFEDKVVHWLFNGDITDRIENIIVKESVLLFKTLSWQNIGLYQCTTEKDGSWLSATSVIQLSQEKTIRNPIKSRKILQINAGVSINLRCQIPTDFDTQNTMVLWYKKRGRKPLSMKNDKYLMYLDGEQNQHVLTIRQTIEGQDNGTYICKIIANETGDILVETNFKVNFNKIKPPNPLPNNDNNPIQQGPMFYISKPMISMPRTYLLAVNITWRLSTNLQIFIDNKTSIIKHYRVEVREGVPKYRPVRWRSSEPMIKWNNSILVDSVYLESSCIIHNSNILKPQYWYSFRALGIPDINFQLQLSSTPKLISTDFYNQLRSPWSDSINFEHILPQKPKIINVTVYNSTQVSLWWSFSSISNILRYQSEKRVEFKVLCIILPDRLLKEQLKEENNQLLNILYDYQLRGNQQLNENIKIITKTSPYKSIIHQLELNSLERNTNYMVTVYGIIRLSNGGSLMYTALSDASFLHTAWKDEEKNNINDGFEHYSNNQTNTSSYFRNKILFLVLGSLAGILFVIALFMFIMCIWYQIMYHNRKRQNISSASSAKTSSATTFPPIGTPSQVANNTLFVTSSNIVSPQNLSLWYKNNRDPSELSHLYLAQHFSLWSPNHLAQFNLPNNLHDQIIDETKSKKASESPTTLSTPSPKSNIDIEINNLDGSIEDSQEESVRLLDYQTHSSSFRREQQCTLNNAFSVQSEGRDRKDQESMSDYARSISHYPFSPSALDIYSQKKRPKMCSTSRKDFSSIKINLKQCKFQNANYFLPIRTRLSCFFPSAPKTNSPTPCSPITSSFCKDNSLNRYNRLKKDDTFAEHPFPNVGDYMAKTCLTNIRENSNSNKQSTNYSSMKAPNSQKLSSKFLFDPIVDLNIHEDTHSSSTAASARHFSFSMYPDGVRPCINLDLDHNNQTNL